MTYSLRSEFYRILIQNRLGHGIKSRKVRVNRFGLVQIQGNPRCDRAIPTWKTEYIEANMIADIEGVLEMEGRALTPFASSRRHRSPVMRARLGGKINRSA